MASLNRLARLKALALACALNLGGLSQAQFETRSSVPSPYSFAAAVGDFNRDGRLDTAVASTDLQVFLGNGDGTFEAPTNYLDGTGVIFVATADFNGDGKPDLAAADLNGLYVLLGNGDGTFQTPILYTTACVPNFVGAGDFNGDHKTDLLVNYSGGSCAYVSLFLGNGDGTFEQPPINTTPSIAPAAVGIGDFNRDGKLDIAIAEQFGTVSQVEIMLGNRTGGFTPGATYTVGSFPLSIAVSDFRSDGKLDLAVATLYGGTTVLLGNGDGTFQAGGSVATSDSDWIVSADFNGDGKPDLAAAIQGGVGIPSGIDVALGNGDGTFQAPIFYSAGANDRFVATGDFNGDRKTDLLVPAYSGDVIVLLNTGVASFSPTTPVSYPFQLVGSTSPPQSVTLTNTGANPLTVSSIRAGSPFRENNTCGKSVSPGATCRIEVIFTPQSASSVTGTLSISDSASSKPQVIELTGAGTVVALSPLSLSFTGQTVGTKSQPQTVALTNKGATTLSITQVYVGGTDYKDFSESNNCPSSLGAGTGCTITVTFDPLKTGTRRAAIYVVDSGGGSPQYITLTGTGD